ncbi:MAG: copper homeostasis protein CutC [bacterium]|nr:copper homeostasis protein CutC [bacterium]
MLIHGFELEVCVDRMDHALAAAGAGATRIEYNQALDLGGLTPSPSACQMLVRECPVPIVAMLRPHAYNFMYSPREQACILRECEALLDTGVQGIVFGSLLPSGQLDLAFLAKVVDVCQDREVVLHRAFDAIPDQPAALPALIELGVRRILTSGGAASAMDGSERLRRLHQMAGQKLEILPGGGVTADCLPKLLEATGCRQFHGSFRCGSEEPNLSQIRSARDTLERCFKSESKRLMSP